MEVLFNKDQDTIAAISTAKGNGGIAVIRVSGESSLKELRKFCAFLPDKPESHKMYFGRFKSSEDQTLDEVLVAYFSKGRSFTGEQTLEIYCHGGWHHAQGLLFEVLETNIRHAEKGEFTYRAFLNGRLDLVQAEGILNLIESQTKQMGRQSMRQLEGSLSRKYENLISDILWVGSQLEANIDFAAEDIIVAETETLLERIGQAKESLLKLMSSYKSGRALKEGLQVALVGKPNVGKSSLLNSILEKNQAIVSETPGTTRDRVFGSKIIDGVEFQFVDTAGIQSTSDSIECIGIEYSFSTIKESDIILLVVDLSSKQLEIPEFFDVSLVNEKKVVVVFNKSDLGTDFEKVNSFMQESFGTNENVVHVVVSAKENLNISALIEEVTDLSDFHCVGEEDVVVSSRHFDELTKVYSHLLIVEEQLKFDDSPEFSAFEIKDAVKAMYRIVGKVYDDQIIDKVFKDFCLGK